VYYKPDDYAGGMPVSFKWRASKVTAYLPTSNSRPQVAKQGIVPTLPRSFFRGQQAASQRRPNFFLSLWLGEAVSMLANPRGMTDMCHSPKAPASGAFV
jgi:hypothetical protein